MLFRFLVTLIYGAIGLYLAFPLSYWFQSPVFREMTWLEYMHSGTSILLEGAQFGSFEVYRYSAMVTVVSVILLGRFVEWLIAENKY